MPAQTCRRPVPQPPAGLPQLLAGFLLDLPLVRGRVQRQQAKIEGQIRDELRKKAAEGGWRAAAGHERMLAASAPVLLGLPQAYHRRRGLRLFLGMMPTHPAPALAVA